jgi:hypothetical protein
LFYFVLFPNIIKKTYWCIVGCDLIDGYEHKANNLFNIIHTFNKKFVLKRVYAHITHISGDSDLANVKFKSKAKYFYSNGYLSNVVTKYIPSDNLVNQKSKSKKILVGNSTSPNNDHISIFQMLLPYKNYDITIYCPLSYGIFNEYKNEVITKGRELFGEKFIPITEFMKIDDYLLFIEGIDIAVFNHNRQEAMGVTLMLLSMGKIVYMNPNTTSFKSLTERGIKVFDNNLICTNGLFFDRDVSSNPQAVYKEYNIDRFKESLTIIFTDKL